MGVILRHSKGRFSRTGRSSGKKEARREIFQKSHLRAFLSTARRCSLGGVYFPPRILFEINAFIRHTLCTAAGTFFSRLHFSHKARLRQLCGTQRKVENKSYPRSLRFYKKRLYLIFGTAALVRPFLPRRVLWNYNVPRFILTGRGISGVRYANVFTKHIPEIAICYSQTRPVQHRFTMLYKWHGGCWASNETSLRLEAEFIICQIRNEQFPVGINPFQFSVATFSTLYIIIYRRRSNRRLHVERFSQIIAF